MSDFDNAVVAAMIKAKEIGVKMLASDCDAILQAAIASMQGEAVAYARPDDVAMKSYPDLSYSYPVRTKIEGEFTQPIYTHAPYSAARISELEQQLEAYKTSIDDMTEIHSRNKSRSWVMQCLRDRIDAAIRQIGGAE